MRREATGQVLCDPCWTNWNAVRGGYPPGIPPMGLHQGSPNPGLALGLGFIPGVGAMYNGQFIKGFIHVIVFAVLVSLSDHLDVFGIIVAAWIAYQVFDAYQTAKARRDGLPLPDPLAMNELANWFQSEIRRSQGAPPPPPGAGYQPPGSGSVTGGAAQASSLNQAEYQTPPSTTYTGAPPAGGFAPQYPPPPATGYPSGFPPPPPVASFGWKRREPIAAIVLIAMGVLFLLGQISGRVLAFTWPVALIALGVWLVVRRLQDAPPAVAVPGAQPPASGATSTAETRDEQEKPGDDLPGGLR